MAKRNNQTENLLKFIESYIEKNSYAPSVRDMCEGMNISSTATIVYHLRKLEKEGKLSRGKQKNRAIDIKKPKQEGLNLIPIIGKVAAGEPILATENIEDNLAFSANVFGSGEDLFILNVSGESMINAGIYDGDKVVVHKQSTAENGEIVVALIDDSATVKRFFKEQNHIRLQPENDFMEPIIVKDVSILGKVVGLIRQYK